MIVNEGNGIRAKMVVHSRNEIFNCRGGVRVDGRVGAGACIG